MGGRHRLAEKIFAGIGDRPIYADFCGFNRQKSQEYGKLMLYTRARGRGLLFIEQPKNKYENWRNPKNILPLQTNRHNGDLLNSS